MRTDVSNGSLEPVWDDGEFVLSRATHTNGGGPMLVVTPALAQPAPASLGRLEHAYALRDELDSSWAARPVELIRHRGQVALVVEHPDGELLTRPLGSRWDVPAFLRVAIGLANSLARLHQRGLIHKDVKPSNILANDVTGHVWLTGFGMASFLARDRQAPEPPDVIAGTLAYMAPEQTGRMNRSIDARSDLYACGVTLYEMLTGALPFSASDPLERSHRHVARPPTPPHERADGIPAAISAIVMKLLSKDAADRYQTALGLEADLRRCLTAWEPGGRIEAFPLGTHDVPDRLLIPEQLYGRAQEIETLLEAFDRVVADGAPELVLVSGYAGAGKSSVVNELKALVSPRGLFASGKFEQYKRDIPYGTLADALQSLVRRILSERDADLVRWREAIRQAVGPNGQLIVNLVPEVALVIGAQPPVADLSPPDTQTRFQMVLGRFLGVFARPEHPLALFLDDLQWLDAATLDFLAHLAVASEVQHLLVIGAYRDNEVGPSHPLRRTLEAIGRAGARVREIVLAPLALDQVVRLVSDALHCEPAHARPLAELVHQKTAGNPFFAIQFLTALADEGLLAFDAGAAAWTWDVTRIAAKGYTDNVVDLMVGKLSRLSPVTQEALKRFACVGNRAEISTLSIVHATSEAEVHADLWEALRLEFIVRVEGAYQFVHDRVQEAACAVIPEALRAEAHLRIGRRLLAHTPPEKREEAIFDIEALAHELAARFYAARGFETIAHAHFRSARYGYLRWGADGKVRQLDQSHPSLREDAAALGPTATIAASLDRLDLATVVKMSRAISEEIVLEKLIHTLLVMTVQHAGAERGLLILPDGERQRVAAEATTGDEGIAVRFVGEPTTPAALPGSILTYVLRTREDVMLDDASVENPYSADEYIARSHVRSVLCLPLVKQGKLTGVLYLENDFASHVFTPARIAVLKLLASQAATSLENAHLYADLLASEHRLRLAIDTIPAIVGRMDGSTIEFLNKRWYDYIGVTSEESAEAQWMAVVHPDDIPRIVDVCNAAQAKGEPYEAECRMRRADGVYRWFLYRALPLRDQQGGIVKWYAVAHDIDDQRRAEDKVRQDERELRLLVDFVPQFISALNLDGTIRYTNRVGLEYLGRTLDEVTQSRDHRATWYHPDDLTTVRNAVARALSMGISCEVEARMRRHDGQYRWFLIRFEPFRDDHGRIIRWYGTGTDIDDRKRAEERVHGENLALREQVAQASMFDEIVGASAPLRALLSHVSKVARTDSTVLITGETGTGKELVARAIHKRSPRAGRAFISLNCAVIPSALIASELFGHEKGAFTGALQRRLGRFELAEGGTIFLDEIGELPAETQVALLRVLQERTFERVGGTDAIHADVRVIVATNRDLSAAIAAGSFRRDLFYRLNVFPVEMPPLRARTEDIPMLVEYFIDRYASKAGKRIRGVDQATLELLQSYSWPGNIRELQNVIERAVILCETDTLSVDKSWLPRSPSAAGAPDSGLTDAVQAHEKALIESALAASAGRVSGRHGAAARLSLPASTLDAKIRSLKINKHQYKRP